MLSVVISLGTACDSCCCSGVWPRPNQRGPCQGHRRADREPKGTRHLFVDAIRSVCSIAELLRCIGDLSFWLKAFLMRPCPACTVSERWASTYRARMCIVHGVICIDKVWHFATRAVQRACCSSHSAGSYKSLTTLSIGDQNAKSSIACRASIYLYYYFID